MREFLIATSAWVLLLAYALFERRSYRRTREEAHAARERTIHELRRDAVARLGMRKDREAGPPTRRIA